MAPYATLNMGLSTDDPPQNVVANRRIAFAALDVAEETVLFARLSHGREVSVFRRDRPEEWPVSRLARRDGGVDAAFTSDAAITNASGLNFSLTFADCVPLAFLDVATGAIGAAHAGWRGTSLGIGPAVVDAMGMAFGTSPGNLVVGIGPSIGPCCYTVRAEVVEDFAQHGQSPAMVGTRLDLWKTNREQLVSAGVRPNAIETAGICTRCNTADYFSHRGENGRTGRFAMIIGS